MNTCHIVAIPFPGRGHINPLMNLCNLILRRRPETLISFVVTEEWLGFIGSEPKPENLRFRSIPNVIPSEIGRGKDMVGFFEAVNTKLEAPVDELLDRLTELPRPSVIISDSYLPWVVGLGRRRNIPVASFWPMSAQMLSILLHYRLLSENGQSLINNSEQGEDRINDIPGVSSIHIVDLPSRPNDQNKLLASRVFEAVFSTTKTQYLLFSSINHLEAETLNVLNSRVESLVYCVGPAIPLFGSIDDVSSHPEYMQWLDAQPSESVLYISQGSFLSIAEKQLEEIIAGVLESGIRFLWVTREDSSRFQSGKGLVVPWCNQFKVLCHSSIGGFWSHCGWNSIKEGVFAGVPFLAFPIFADQVPNCKQIVEDWKTGWRVKKKEEDFLTRDEISRLVQRFMDLESDEGKEIRRRARLIQGISQQEIVESGPVVCNIDAFLREISS